MYKIKMKQYKRLTCAFPLGLACWRFYPSAHAIKHGHFDRKAGKINKRCIHGDERVLIHNQAVFRTFGRFRCIRRLVCIIGRLSLRYPEMPCGSDDTTFLSSVERTQTARRRRHDGKGKHKSITCHKI